MAGLGAALMPALAWANSTGEGYGHGGRMMGGGHMFYGPVMMIVAIAVIIGIVVLVMCSMGRCRKARGTGEKSPQDILKERYARGEMTTKEFEERRKALGD